MNFAEDGHRYARSPAFRELHPLRIPTGWSVGWNDLFSGNRAAFADESKVLFLATQNTRRFQIEATVRHSAESPALFELSVLYSPYDRSRKGHRRSVALPVFDNATERVHSDSLNSFDALVTELEYWMAVCTVWTREGN